MAKIYTKTGDEGNTGLYGVKRISKSELRIEAYGTVDELNSHLGLIASFDLSSINKDFIYKIQSDLFNMGSLLAADPNKNLTLPSISSTDIKMLETAIDEMETELPKLKTFILPGGSQESSHTQIARAVCRRAERRAVQLHSEEPVDILIIQYLNRLSDYLFVLARFIVFSQKKNEIPWKPSI